MTSKRKSVPKANYFAFTQYTADWDSGKLAFEYEVGMADGSTIEFKEHVEVPLGFDMKRAESQAVTRALEALHLVQGLSYYKAHLAPEIRHPYTMTQKQADFWNTLYTKGLGEFYYINDVDFRGRVNFHVKDTEVKSDDVSFEEKALILHGGGKDSVVSVELVKTMDMDFDIFSMNTSQIQEAVAKVIGKEMKVITRKFDRHIVTLNNTGETYDGHIPISSIFAFLSLLYALLYGHKYVITSNERSAVYGSIEYCGIDVNHQWSKSQEFEKIFREYVSHTISSKVEFFSYLRPLYELRIAQLFSKYPQYFEHFSSSNHNFVVIRDKKPQRWDVDYSKGKVEFVWALLSAFLPRENMLRIFQENVYDRDDKLDTYKELLGTKDIKPLDCVGTPEEMKLAMYMAHERGEFDDTPVMKYFVDEVLPAIEDVDALKEEAFSYGDDSHIPEKFRAALQAALKE